ncbi:dynein light chain Tctex-type 1 [Antrostomus carolinensis]|uniref:dynein light chain Tctex-type 1 n=1 Tax=Antrostomus carolinensis TaxID=279965 RepID=UPI0005283414|nr:dynein light chain Tctex-type 1 [Antrostomus carolinensis]
MSGVRWAPLPWRRPAPASLPKAAAANHSEKTLEERDGSWLQQRDGAVCCGRRDGLGRREEEPNTLFTSFVVDEVSGIIKEAIESAIGGNAYQHSKVNQWTTSVVEQTLSQLTKLGKPFKYIVTCVIMQKNGAGLHTASSCFWDNSSDGTCTVRWENKTMYCIVSAFGLAI